jgi:hypothetical protein
MLGLGNSIVNNSRVLTLEIINTYTSDFSSGVDGWSGSSIQGTLTLTGNQDSIDGENDWLKGEFDTTQTDGQSGIMREDTFTDVQLGDQFSFSGKIRHISGTDHWDGSDDVTVRVVPAGNSNAGVWDKFVALAFGGVQDESTTFDSGIIENVIWSVSGDYQDPKIMWIFAGDKPKAGAVFYVKDIVINQYRYV